MISVSADQFKRFQSLIYNHSGIRLDDRKHSLLQSRMQRRLRQLKVSDVDEYYRMVTRPGGKDEMQALIDVVTTNETSFFRTQQHFDWFSKVFLPEIIASGRLGKRPKTLRIWSAACSNGAEPYSLLFCLDEKRVSLQDWQVEVMGSDLSLTTLAQARQARYSERLLEPFIGSQKKRYFKESEQSEGMFQIRPEFRERVTFFQHNLIKPLNLPAMRRPSMDCIFLRNVLIYFDDASKQLVLKNIAQQLAPGGYLVIGPSEGIFGLDNPLNKMSTFLYQKPLLHGGSIQ